MDSDRCFLGLIDTQVFRRPNETDVKKINGHGLHGKTVPLSRLHMSSYPQRAT